MIIYRQLIVQFSSQLISILITADVGNSRNCGLRNAESNLRKTIAEWRHGYWRVNCGMQNFGIATPLSLDIHTTRRSENIMIRVRRISQEQTHAGYKERCV